MAGRSPGDRPPGKPDSRREVERAAQVLAGEWVNLREELESLREDHSRLQANFSVLWQMLKKGGVLGDARRHNRGFFEEVEEDMRQRSKWCRGPTLEQAAAEERAARRIAKGAGRRTAVQLRSASAGLRNSVDAIRAQRLWVLGGQTGSRDFSFCNCTDTFTVSRGRWEQVPSAEFTRSAHSGAAIGRVIYLCGGVSGAGREVEASCVRFDTKAPRGKQWRYVRPMSTQRFYAAAASLGRSFYVCGGINAAGDGVLESVERYLPSEGDDTDGYWEQLSPMLEARQGHAALAFKGRLFICGGTGVDEARTASRILGSSETLIPGDTEWDMLPCTMAHVRHCHSATVLKGKIYVAGGEGGMRLPSAASGFGPLLGSVEVYDPDTVSWSFCSYLALPRTHVLAAALSGRLYVCGGISATPQRDVAQPLSDIFDAEAGEWEPAVNLPQPRAFAVAIVIPSPL